MKNNAKYIVLGLLVSLTLSIQARSFVAGEELYVNMQQDFDWTTANAKLYLYLFNSTGNMWLDLTQENGKLYKGTFSSNCSYDQAIVVRKNPVNAGHDWTGVWTQTGDIDIVDDWNCIDNFNDAGHRWKMYSPALEKIPAYTAAITAEIISVCPSASSDPLSLKAKLNSSKTEYAYGDVHGHAWYSSTDGTTWTSLDGNRGLVRDGEDLIDTIITLPNPIPAAGMYYYLHSSNPRGRRLIHLVQQTEGCDLDCEITSFETAISAVNADDNTYTLDGMVAFGIANGSLVIECDGVSVSIDDAHSPQSFSLHGVPAATVDGKKTKAYAHFTGNGACRDSIEVAVPNATEAVAVQTRDSLTGKTITLIPTDYDVNNTYVWLADGDTIEGAPQVLVIDPFNVDTTVTYTYKEYYPASGNMDDMMNNGGYEDPTMDYGTYGNVSTISDYNFWGRFPQTAATQINFYTDTLAGGVNPSKLNRNGFAVVQNANNFWHSYAQVRALEGNDFALFDAETGAAGGNKKAWYATTAMNPKLKLQKGTTYVLSFWAANINNYGEMDNAARFVFRIEYNGHVWNSDTLDLSKPEFRNNRWHQHSETFYADEDCDNVTISVVNLNTNTLNIGNDFALDDIQFHPISSVSKVVKSQQQFVVNAHEPKVDAFTATTVDMLCTADLFTVNMSVQYRNAQGSLCIRDTDRDTVYLFSVPKKAIEVQGTYNCVITLPDSLATAHSWEAYFQVMPANNRTVQSVVPQRYSCDKTDTVLCEGETFTWQGTVYPQTPFIGTDTFTSGYDTLILTVNAIPVITIAPMTMTCDEEANILMPFTVVKGAPDSFDIAINGNHYTGSVVGTDISFVRATELVAGDYSATVTVGQTGIDCTTEVDVNFTVALGGSLLSKWTDVLFIDNSSQRFIGYQWFKNGVEMSGETEQRLYDPNGLSGTTDEYMCRLTTGDGQTIYTCPEAFDDVTPSRTLNNGSSSEVIGIYDTMGRPVQGTLHNGIYIVLEETDGEIQTRKMLIHE